jgi:hypothetical protein
MEDGRAFPTFFSSPEEDWFAFSMCLYHCAAGKVVEREEDGKLRAFDLVFADTAQFDCNADLVGTNLKQLITRGIHGIVTLHDLNHLDALRVRLGDLRLLPAMLKEKRVSSVRFSFDSQLTYISHSRDCPASRSPWRTRCAFFCILFVFYVDISTSVQVRCNTRLVFSSPQSCG